MSASDDSGSSDTPKPRPWIDDDLHRGGFFPPSSTPRAVVGGIRLQGKARGGTGASWWSRRWLAALEATGAGERLERGLAYARDGQVVSLDIELGAVVARVQGTRTIPYEARIEVRRLEQGEWLLVADALAAQASYRAALLAGTMPDDVEAVFARAGAQLFPSLEDDLTMTCTCVDWASPCRHVAAACYLVGEALDRDPFLAFRLRGIERDVLLTLVQGRTADRGADMADDAAPRAAAPPTSVVLPEPTVEALDVAAFWRGADAGAPAAAIPIDLQPPAIDAPLVRILGAPAQWRGAAAFEPSVARMLAAAARDLDVLDTALGTRPAD